ncbi:EbhA [Streptococcus australis]|uniref:EbhA n=1 Tax=Streptococcus australis TaxID=113107 RepID=UPI0039C1BEDB
MKKNVITTAVVLALATGGTGYYFLSYAPRQTAISHFEKSVDTLNENNKAIEKQIADTEKIIKEKAEPLEAKTLDDLKTSVKEAKTSIRKAPKMESDTQKIEYQAKEIAKPVDYSSVQKNITEKLTVYQNSVKQLAQITNPKDTFIEERLKEIDTIQGVQHVTEDHDPNGSLNKQGGYTATVYFSDKQVTEPIEGNDIVEKGTDAGGSIEVYKTKEEAEKRNAYLSAFDGGPITPGSHYVYGTIVVRTSHHLTASQQKALTEKIYNKLIELK